METKVTLIEEIAMRLGLKTHPIFKKVRTFAVIGTIILGSVAAFNQAVPNETISEILKYVGLIGAALGVGLASASSLTVAPEERPVLEAKKEEKILEKLAK